MLDADYLQTLRGSYVVLYQDGVNTKRRPPIHGVLRGPMPWSVNQQYGWFVRGRRLRNKSYNHYDYFLTEADVVVPDTMTPPPYRSHFARQRGIVYRERRQS